MANRQVKEKKQDIVFEHECPIEEVAAMSWETHIVKHPKITVKDSAERIRGFLKRPNVTQLVLLKDGELIGCAYSFEENEEEIKQKVPYANFFTRPKERVFEIKGVVVRPEKRGQGFGRMIVEKIMSETRQKGATKIILSTFPEKDSPARNLYEKLGFKEAAPDQDPGSFFMVYEYPEENKN